MNTLIILVLFIIGLIFIIKGGDYFVDSASWIAEVSGIPKFIIGATIVSMATTLPEILVSTMATYQGELDIAAGNAIGSVTANVGFIMAISVMALPSMVKRSQIAFKGTLLILACALLLVFSQKLTLTIVPSIIMILVFAVFMAENVITAKKVMNSDTDEKLVTTKNDKIKNIAKFVVGIIGIVAGAQLLVDNGSALAEAIGIPKSIIGVTLVAIGTSLPELVTTLTAISKKQSSLSIGNIVGANIIDLALIMPVCSFISKGTLQIPAQSAFIDLPVCLAVISIAIIPAIISQKFRRWQGVTMVGCYVAYLVVLCGGFITF